ncbi:unnamed protein product [Psylliodes chrysocephalus]|uniref:Uncharacterized protein n=1 Tax=Psylliodes chrysocephalus TaxID=3402493 RepID=A0A9P0CX09_9CUCU|nr:unnamed protein product [Psylliodes chrysocephala]
MTHDRFYDLKALQEAWGTNFNMDEDKNQAKWHDIKVLKVEKENLMVFFYKTSFAEAEFKKCWVNKRKTRRTEVELTSSITINLRRAYAEKITLSDAKEDNKELVDKNMISNPYCDSFYKNVL